MSIPLPYLPEFVGEVFGLGYWVGMAAVSSVVVCELPAFGAVFPGEWLAGAFIWWMAVDVGVGGGMDFVFWDGGVLSCSLIEQVCSFRFPSPEFDPIGWNSGHRNGSMIFFFEYALSVQDFIRADVTGELVGERC